MALNLDCHTYYNTKELNLNRCKS